MNLVSHFRAVEHMIEFLKLTEWNKYDGRLMRLIEEGDLKDIASYLKKKKTISTKLDPQGHSA